MKTFVYKQWKSERGTPYEVLLTDFIGYHKKPDGYDTVIKEDDLKYKGEIWNCINLETKQKEQCIIKVEYEKLKDDVGWNYNNPIDQPIDTWVNPLVDEYEDWLAYCNSHAGKIIARHYNRELKSKQDQLNNRIKLYKKWLKSINNDLKPYLKLKLNMITKPSLRHFNEWKKVSNDIRKKLEIQNVR